MQSVMSRRFENDFWLWYVLLLNDCVTDANDIGNACGIHFTNQIVPNDMHPIEPYTYLNITLPTYSSLGTRPSSSPNGKTPSPHSPPDPTPPAPDHSGKDNYSHTDGAKASNPAGKTQAVPGRPIAIPAINFVTGINQYVASPSTGGTDASGHSTAGYGLAAQGSSAAEGTGGEF